MRARLLLPLLFFSSILGSCAPASRASAPAPASRASAPAPAPAPAPPPPPDPAPAGPRCTAPATASATSLHTLLSDPGTTVLIATITTRQPRPGTTGAATEPKTLITRVTELLGPSAMKVGDEVRAESGGDGMKALRPMDDRVTAVGASLLFACGKTGAAVTTDTAGVRRAAERCLELNAGGTATERANRLASALAGEGVKDGSEGEVLRVCAKRAACRADRLTAVTAIARVAATYTGDPMTVWTLLDGLRVRSDGSFARELGCAQTPRLVDPSQGADEANVATFGAQLAYASAAKTGGPKTWLTHAQETLLAMKEDSRGALVEKVERGIRTAAVATIDALPAQDKTTLARLRTALAAP